MNTGMKTIEWLFNEQLKVDDKWSVRTPNGFRWWADKNEQTVEVIGQETGPDGDIGYLVSVRTELLRSVHLGDRELEGINALLMAFASMAGPVYDQEAKTLSLCSLVRVYDAISEWMNPVISVAAVLQIGEVRIIASELAKVIGAEQAFSGPPQHGMRPEPDEMAGIIATVITPMGRQPSRWSPAEFQDAVDRFMNQPPALLRSAGGAGFTVEFPYGDQSSLCQAMADQPHPRYGNGLFLLQSFPVKVTSDTDGVKLALSMNKIELTDRPFGYGFGSYAYRDSMLRFTAFLPNALYRPGLLPNIYFSCAQRAHEMSVRLAGNDLTLPSSYGWHASLQRSPTGDAMRLDPMPREHPLQVVMYVYRDLSGMYFIVLESLKLDFGFPAAKTKEYGEVIDLLNEIGAKLNNGDPIRSVSPQHTLRLNRFGNEAPEDEEFQEERARIDRGEPFELVTYNVKKYFDEASGEMVPL